MNTQNPFSRFLVPLAVSTAAVPSCVDSYPEEAHQALATASSEIDTPHVIDPATSHVAQKNLCDIGNDTWAAVSKSLSCDEMTPDHLKQITFLDSKAFLNKLKGLLMTSKVTKMDASVILMRLMIHKKDT